MNEDLKEALIQLGTDMKGTMDRFIHNEKLYESFLFKFVKDTNFSLLKENIEKKNYEAAFQAGHTLKGIVGNLGFQPLWKLITPIVDALRYNSTDNLQSMLDDFEQAYNQFVNTIQSYVE